MNKDLTLTVADLLHALQDGRIQMETPIGFYCPKTQRMRGVSAFELHGDDKVFVLRDDPVNSDLASEPLDPQVEVF